MKWRPYIPNILRNKQNRDRVWEGHIAGRDIKRGKSLSFMYDLCKISEIKGIAAQNKDTKTIVECNQSREKLV